MQLTKYSTADSYIYSHAATTNYGSNNSVLVAFDAAEDQYWNGLFKFDLSQVLVDKLLSAKLRLYGTYPDYPYFNDGMNVHRLKRAWTEGGVTYNKYDGVNDWQTPGGTGANDYDSFVLGTKQADRNGPDWFEITLNLEKVKEMCGGSPSFANNGFLVLWKYIESSGSTFTFDSKEKSGGNKAELLLEIDSDAEDAIAAYYFDLCNFLFGISPANL